jgi:hypothetical protein
MASSITAGFAFGDKQQHSAFIGAAQNEDLNMDEIVCESSQNPKALTDGGV